MYLPNNKTKNMTPTQPFFNRLYVRIWLAVVLAVAVLILLVGFAWRQSAERQMADISTAPVVREVLVKNAADDIIGSAKAEPRVPGMGLEFTVQLNKPLAAGETLSIELPKPRRFNPQTGEFETRRRTPELDNRLHPGMANPGNRAWFTPPFGFVGMLVLVGLAVAFGTYPVIRRLTQRLNKLQSGVEQWGEGDLSTRVDVVGNDEVAFLAERFNTAASRIEALVGSHKSLLANASHELRSPLARIKMGLALMHGNQSESALERFKSEISRNIDELDTLIGEILLASRLDSAQADVGVFEPVDLIGMAAEECAQTGAELDILGGASSIIVQGVPKLLRRVMRNLLENAIRYANPNSYVNPSQHQPVQFSLTLLDHSAILRVTDHGPGVPPALRERIFEPFFRAPGASERDGGVGLGLALVKSIVERHGGKVRCESGSDGKGASFVVTLPL